MGRKLRCLILLGALVAGGSGCLGRTLPIPPPGAQVFSENCDTVTCPQGGVIVTLRGTARAGALVVVENLNRQTPEGGRFTAAAYASGEPTTDAGMGVAAGRFEIQLLPLRVPMAPPVVSQRGDRLVVYQLVRTEGGTYEQSESVQLTVE
jgi:hypothetical protein